MDEVTKEAADFAEAFWKEWGPFRLGTTPALAIYYDSMTADMRQTLAAQAAELAALREALHLAASRLQVASVDAIRAGETRLSADCITWANDATRAALGENQHG